MKAFGGQTGVVAQHRARGDRRYFSGDPVRQFNYALRDQVTARGLGLVESARLLAAVNMSVADGLIGGLVREAEVPLLAAGHGDPPDRRDDAIAPDPTWEPFIRSTGPCRRRRRPTRTG